MISITGNYVDVFQQIIFCAEVIIEEGKISKIVPRGTEDKKLVYILPGLVDAHVHIESSMLSPIEFAKVAVRHGTCSVVSDPHEIANVLGEEGVNYMIENGKKVPLKFYFGAPSCVPATSFETSGNCLDSAIVDRLLVRDDVYFLAEVMNFPGVIYKDPDLIKKIESAEKHCKPIDGHAPGLKGNDLEMYASAGISTDHECMTIEEALEKLKNGIKIQIREGSAAKNFEALHPLVDLYPEHVMICTDDCHPDNLVQGHINEIIKTGLKKGLNVFNLLRAASINPIEHYKLESGMLRQGDPADLCVVNNLEEFEILATIIDGEYVFKDNQVFFDVEKAAPINLFYKNKVLNEDLELKLVTEKIKLIEVFDGELYTKMTQYKPNVALNNTIPCSITDDVLKIMVLNRYNDAKPVVGFIKNFGLKRGALASTVAHDSHNIIAIGVSDDAIVKVVEQIQKNEGGIVAYNGDYMEILPLPIAGLMSDQSAEFVALRYKKLDQMAKEMGSMLHAPFMTMAFMALLVIPEFKIGDKGLFDGLNFKFDTLFVNE